MVAIAEIDQTHLGELISEGIQDILKQSYRSTPHKSLSMTPNEFVVGMLKRLYDDGNYDDDFDLSSLGGEKNPILA